MALYLPCAKFLETWPAYARIVSILVFPGVQSFTLEGLDDHPMFFLSVLHSLTGTSTFVVGLRQRPGFQLPDQGRQHVGKIQQEDVSEQDTSGHRHRHSHRSQNCSDPDPPVSKANARAS